MALTRRDAGYLLVLVWSFAGVAVKQATAPNVVLAGWVAAGSMAALAVYALMRPKSA